MVELPNLPIYLKNNPLKMKTSYVKEHNFYNVLWFSTIVHIQMSEHFTFSKPFLVGVVFPNGYIFCNSIYFKFSNSGKLFEITCKLNYLYLLKEVAIGNLIFFSVDSSCCNRPFKLQVATDKYISYCSSHYALPHYLSLWHIIT